MAEFEEGDLEFGEEVNYLKDEEFGDFIDDDDLKDLTINVPEKSRIYASYGGQQLSDRDWEARDPCDFDVQHYNLLNSIRERFKFMSAKAVSTAEAKNNFLDDFVDAIMSTCQSFKGSMPDEDFKAMVEDLADSEMTLLDEKTAVEMFYIGRIRFGYHNKQISNKNIALEASVSHGKGLVIPLDLSLFKKNGSDGCDALKQVSLFPGQIVVIKAQNTLGNFLRVVRFYPIGQLFSPNFELKPSKILGSDIPFHMVCASGPFVSMDTPDFDLTNTKYMRALGDYVRTNRPNVLFLCGSFYDTAHIDQIMQWSTKSTVTEKGSLPYLWPIEKLFQNQLRAFTKELEGQHLGTKICYIPSPNEIGANNIFPTYPHDIKPTVPIQSFASPSFLNIDNITVGISTADILMHLSRFEISNIQNADSDRLRRLCSHVLDHRHFYPLCPPDPSLNLEASLYEKLTMPMSPNILILPSVLRPFALELNKTIVINPGRVCRNSIARIRIDPVDPAKWTGDLSSQTKVEIIKLIQ